MGYVVRPFQNKWGEKERQTEKDRDTETETEPFSKVFTFIFED